MSITAEPEVGIRGGSFEDLPRLVDLQRRASAAGYPDPVRRLLTSQPELIAESFRYEWFSTDQVRVAIKDQRLAGFAVLERSEPPEAEIAALFVDPDHWRTGVGRALVEALASLASEWGRTRLWVLANPIALGFYTATGFVHDRYVDMPNAASVPRLIRDIDPHPS